MSVSFHAYPKYTVYAFSLTEHFTTIWPQNPSTGVSERHKVNPYLDIKAMKLRYVRLGLDD